MNEPTIKLYKQAQEFAYKNISKEYWNTDNFHAVVSGKFAELIVKKCMGLCYRIDTEYEGKKVKPTVIASKVAEHFGVEE